MDTNLLEYDLVTRALAAARVRGHALGLRRDEEREGAWRKAVRFD